mmetsp:Transcript_18439/g.50617  ORF Transcript_18439/g.50617 Transcript_18439/m.50617 type:complete len:565 (-) Transcript_18439:146-1840(-)|eukprot:CAMPEP_0117577750 /NCGR_PEP_ID=MMETSP0784-20121206/63597_1 /TAXON_ID=39447 /ORGANISM="" /LENGTH=564 /DNA_ID=CAMNT_0005377289 /DNA_START=80 /DNA_END=1774 /DNA_ORIENTATION=+
MTEPDLALLGLGVGSNTNTNVAKIAIEQRRKKTDVEPQVISEELLIDGVEEPVRPDGELWEPIDFPKVTSLRLSFLNIIEVSNLCNFDMLTTLRLDNNIIDKIANLNHLGQLMWLDLSFNNIREIEGLDRMHNLLDLSLYHNQIEEIKGLDGCSNLNILSLGHNNIRDLKQIDNLRPFTNLRCLCLDKNKVCSNDSYKQHVHAYLPHLKYLDYMLIDQEDVAHAQEAYNMEELTEVREREQQEAAKVRQKKEKEAILAKLKLSFLDVTEDLFEELFSKELEPEHVTVLSCYSALKEVYRDNLAEDIKNLRAWMEERNDVRLKKVTAFEKAVNVAEKESEDEAFQMVRQFKSYMKYRLAQLEPEDGGSKNEVDVVHSVVQQLVEHLSGLEQQLMANEIQLQESIEEAISQFEGTIQEIMKVMLERESEFFRRLEDYEKTFNIGLLENANIEMDTYQQNQESTMADNDTNKARFLGNRDEMNQACTNFNEAHMVIILNKEDQMQNQMNNWRTSFFGEHRERQYHRNRQRIMDVKKVVDDCRQEIDSAGEAVDYEDEQGDGGDQYMR